MDKLNELGGTEVMHHRAAARPETVERVKRQEEARKPTMAGTGGKWLRKRTRATHLTPG